MRKFLLLLMTVIITVIGLIPTTYAGDDIKLTIDVNERYTNIQEKPEDDIYINNPELEEEKTERNQKKIAYITVLSVLLVIAVVVLIVTLKKAPDNEINGKPLSDDPAKARLQKDIVVRKRRKSEDITPNKKDS